MKGDLETPDLLNAREAELARCELSFGHQLWRAVRGGMPPNPAAYEDGRDRLLGDDSDLVRLEALYRRDGAEAALRRRAALWLSAAAWHRTLRRARFGALLAQLTPVLFMYRGRVGNQLLDLDALRRSLLVDDDRHRREQAYMSLVALAGETGGLVADMRTSLVRAWEAEAGGGPEPGFWNHPLAAFAPEWPGLNLIELADKYLDRTEPLLGRFRHLAGEALKTSQLRAWDVTFGLHALAARYDHFFADAHQLSSLSTSLRSAGLPTDGVPLAVATQPAWLPMGLSGWPGSDWLAVGMGIGAGRLSDQWSGGRGLSLGIAVGGARGSQSFGQDLARATGAAFGTWHGRAGHLARRRQAGGLDPAGALLGALTVEPEHLTHHTEMPAGEVSTYRAQGCPRSGLLRAVELRLLAAYAAAAWMLFADPDQDAASVTGSWLSRAAGTQVDGRLLPLDLATLIDPAHWPLLFVTEIAAGQLAEHLLTEHGKLVGDRRTAECLVECFWRHGMLVPAQRALELATGSTLNLDAEVDALFSHAGV